MKTILAPILAATLPTMAQAHADHATQPLTLWHVLVEPDHAAMIALGIAIVAMVVIKSRAARRDAARAQPRKSEDKSR